MPEGFNLNQKEGDMTRTAKYVSILVLGAALPFVGARVVYAYAQITVGFVTKIECNVASPANNICSIALDTSTPIAGFAGCTPTQNPSNFISFDSSTSGGTAALAIATAAMLSGKRIQVDTMQCFAPWPSVPELRDINIQR